MSNKVKCTCGWSWNKSDSSKKDMYICHQCGKDNIMKDGGWLNKFQDGGEETYGTYELPEVVITPEPEELRDIVSYKDIKAGNKKSLSINDKAKPDNKKANYSKNKTQLDILDDYVLDIANQSLLDQIPYYPIVGALNSFLGQGRPLTAISDLFKLPVGISGDVAINTLQENPLGYDVKSLEDKIMPTVRLAKNAFGSDAIISNIGRQILLSGETSNSKWSSREFNLPPISAAAKSLGIDDNTFVTFVEDNWEKSDKNYKKLLELAKVKFKNNKPLDKKQNGGWLNKFDVPEAQNGIEGTMGGLTDQGFNYNGAWGGTMAMGGSLPGSVGFTYARTQGSAPANGKYTKKTKASAQNGEEMKFYQEGLDWKPKNISKNGTHLEKYQDGGKKTSILAPEVKYMEEYLSSPMYLERLAKMAGTEKQLQDFNPYNKRFSSEQFSHSKITDPLKNVAAKQAKNTKDALNYIKNNVFIGDYDFGNIVPGATIAGVYDSGVKDIRLRKDLFEENPTVGIHELSHATLQGQDPYTTDFHKKYLDPILLEPGSVGWHPIVQVPTEIKARLDSVRYLAKKKGLYDAGKERFTEKHLRTLENDPEIKKDFNFKQLKDQLKPGTKSTGFIWMMNNIAKLQDEKSNYLPLAKDGKVITDPNGQWAHPGEITRIPSNQITMQGVDYPVLGISDTGDTQMMYPNQDYTYDGESVTEYPMMQVGGKVSLRSLMNNDDLKAKSDATKVVPQKTMTKEQAAKFKARKDAEELQRRKSAIAKSVEARSKTFSVQNLADESGAIGDKFRIFPNDPDSFIDEYINPGVMIGNMASGIGRIPLNIQEGNYGQAAMSVATPLAVGALAGIGAQSTGQFANNLVNPFAGTGDLVNNLGNKINVPANSVTPQPSFSTPYIPKTASELENTGYLKNRFYHKELFESKKAEALERLSTPAGEKRLKEFIDDNYKINPDNFGTQVSNPFSFIMNKFRNSKKFTPEQLMNTVKEMEFESQKQYLNTGRDIFGRPTRELVEDHYNPTNAYHWFRNGPDKPSYMALGTGMSPYDALHTFEHEFGHLMQRRAPSNIDNILSNVTLKNKKPITLNTFKSKEPITDIGYSAGAHDPLMTDFDSNLEYFKTGSGGQERYPFAAELRENMLQRGLIKNYYDDITPELVQQHADLYNKTTGSKYPLRLYNLMDNNPENFKTISSALNKMPQVILPVAIGASALQDKKKNGGWLNKYN
jgi:hypothetical protein